MSDDTSTPDEGVTPAPPQPEVPGAPPAPEAMPAPPAEPVQTPETAPPAPRESEPIRPPATPQEPPYVPPPPQPPPFAPPPPPYAPPVEVMPQRPAPASESSKILAALSYIFGVIAIVVLFVEPYKDEKFVRFHAIQGIAVWVVAAVVSVFSWIPFVGQILWLVVAIAIIVGAIKAFQGLYWEVPLIYDAVKGFIER